MAQVPAEIRRRKARQKTKGQPPRALSADQPQLLQARVWGLTLWQWAGTVILFAAAFLRLIFLSHKVLHHDEGVNGLFMVSLFRNGYYHYDPSNYHGPSLYYAGLVTSSIASFFMGKDGLNTFTIRLVPAIFGVGVVWLMLCLRRQLGTFGALCAAALAAVSPGFVFFSRYFIHEILFVFFTLGLIVAWLRYRETGQPRYLMLAAASAALLGATKETWVITAGVWLIAIPCTAIYFRLAEKLFSRVPDQEQQAAAASGNAWTRSELYFYPALLFVGTWVVLYSSFFTNFPQGVIDSVRTFTFWFKTSEAANIYDWKKYFEWLGKAEAPVMLLGAFGIVTALFQARSRFAVFSAFWSMGIFAAYSLVPYKTPWLALSIVLPFVIMAGYGLGQLYDRWRQRGLAQVLVTAAVLVAVVQAADLSFNRYDDESHPYSYAHSKRDLLNLVNEIYAIAAGNPAGNSIGITIMSPEHWPLPWYLRDFPNAGYWGKVVDTQQPIIIALENQKEEVDQKFGDRYRLIAVHDLRPGNRLLLYLRNDLQP